MEHKRKLEELYANTTLELEKSIVKVDVERKELEKEVYRTKKERMTNTLRDNLLKQQSDRKRRQEIEKSQDTFNYQFPFEDEKHPFLITPKQSYGDGSQIVINLPKELPLQHDLQAPQFAHRILKDYHRRATIDNATVRNTTHIDQLKQSKMKHKQEYETILSSMKREEDLRQQLR